MAKRKKVSLFKIALLILIITGLVFLVKGIVNFCEEKFGTFSAEQGADYLSGYGWKINEEKIHTEEITIPVNFSEVYERYNALQKKQGFDLTKYKGEKAVKYTFVITNYKGFDNVEAHILTVGKKVIGGDICSTELNGFMKGFDGKTE